MIEFKDVSKCYTQNKKSFFALSEVNLSIPEGILGTSGAGKSTLLRMINGLILPTSGHVLVDGVAIDTLSTKQMQIVRHSMGMIFQTFNLLATKSVYQNIEIALKAVQAPKSSYQERIMQVLAEVGLTHKRDNYPSQLSGGEKQRVGIARALVTKPKYLLCDEITSALDPKSAKEILDLLKKIHQERSLSIIFITHQVEAVMQLCADVVLMEHGRVIHQSTTLDLFLHLDNRATANYLKAVVYDVPIEHDNVYQLIYVGEILQEESILSHMIRTFNVDVNIIHAKILIIGQQRLGYLYLQILGSSQQQAIDYLQQQGIRVHALANQKMDSMSTS
jgi:D-methionine transport system ATP-binding protein